MTTLQTRRLALVLAGISLFSNCSYGSEYDLNHVDGIESFQGSARAQELLKKNGFVVAAPDFKQIFEPYIESPVPVFVTPDSAWHTYHFLLENGVKELETIQARRLADFSRLLWTKSKALAEQGIPEFRDLAEYASVGLGFQDTNHLKEMVSKEKRLVQDVIADAGAIDAAIGFPLKTASFRPQSFYTESPELKAYYRARQWYAMVDFRLNNDRETHLALGLSWLVKQDPALSKAWQKLMSPYDQFLALPEDATVSNYYAIASKALGTNFDWVILKQNASAIIKRLRAYPILPRINDQLLNPAQYSDYPSDTAGFRLFPARQLPCAVCFQNTVEPKISGRGCPSGIDFFAGAKALRSRAALRAEEKQFGKKVLDGVMRADPGPMPESLYGQSMMLLANLQEPLSRGVPAPFRTEEWSDLQLWTQLGAWAEQRHTWALHAKDGMDFMGASYVPPGIVAPYPKFFTGLAKLARETSTLIEKNTEVRTFEAKQVAAELLAAQKAEARYASDRHYASTEETVEMIRRYYEFTHSYIKEHNGNPPVMRPEGRYSFCVPEEVLKRCAESGTTNKAELDLLQAFFKSVPPSVSSHLAKFASICDRLAGLAGKELAGEIPTQEEAKWLRSYGIALATLHFYEGNSWLEPRDDFAIVSRIFVLHATGSIFYAGVSRPQALYVVLPYKNRMQLYRGAVLSYHEFQRPQSENLDDAAWRGFVRESKAPGLPPFTASFLDLSQPGAGVTN